jgi:hypothetical protein
VILVVVALPLGRHIRAGTGYIQSIEKNISEEIEKYAFKAKNLPASPSHHLKLALCQAASAIHHRRFEL